MEDLMKHTAEALLPILGALLTAFSSYAVTLIAKRLKLKLRDEEQAMLRGAVRNAIAGAEEWAARKANLDTNPVAGARKAQWVHERIKENFPKLAPDELDRILDEELAMIADVGATKEKKLET